MNVIVCSLVSLLVGQSQMQPWTLSMDDSIGVITAPPEH